ncbi:MAG: dipeptidase [Bdellovibrio sp.]|nr:MAG: dipeptidase [Bdellovibrio sp.]
MTNIEQKVQPATTHFLKNKEKYYQWLSELVAIPSVSFEGFSQEPVYQCALKVADLMKEVGLNHVQILEGENSLRPYIYGERIEDPQKPTVLFYAHYDVQPPGDEALWLSPPFQLQDRNQRLYGRGAADDKGGVLLDLATVDCWVQGSGKLPVNVKVLMEGEEEIGSPGLETFLEKHVELLSSDMIIIPDVENYDQETPGITVSLRGIVPFEVEVQGYKQSLHSGLWSGPLPDPAMSLCQMIASLVDDKGNIALPEILSMVDTQKKSVPPFDAQKFREEAGLLDGVQFRVPENHIKESLWFEPSLTVNAFQASSRQQAGNIICDRAWAKLSIRTVPFMEPQKVFDLVKAHLEKVCPFGLHLSVTSEGFGDWWQTSTDHKAFQAMQDSMKRAWGKDPVLMGCGASIPFVQSFTEALGGVPALLIGVEDAETKAHSENESLSKQGWEKAVVSCIYFLEEVSESFSSKSSSRGDFSS